MRRWIPLLALLAVWMVAGCKQVKTLDVDQGQIDRMMDHMQNSEVKN